jgi:hypothetical protein
MKKLVYLLILLLSISFVFGSSAQYVFQDYDGDGITDRGVFFPSHGWWYVQLSSGGEISLKYGDPGDIPVPGNYFDKNKQCFVDSQCDDGWDCSVDICGADNVCAWDYAGCECYQNSQCDDKNICTTDSCQNGACVQNNNQNNCNDGNACTLYDVCSQGSCSGITNDCDDGWDCSIDSCNLLNGDCIHTTTSCECENDERCDDGNACTTNTCEGTCVTKDNKNTCDDGNACTLNDTCSQGSCSGNFKKLGDGNLLTVDKCLENGTIIHYTTLNLSEYLDYETETTTSSDNSGNSGSPGLSEDSSTGTNNADFSSTDSDNLGTSNDGLSGWKIFLIWFFIIAVILGGGYLAYLYFHKGNNNGSKEQRNNLNKKPIIPRNSIPKKSINQTRRFPPRRPMNLGRP